MNVKNSTLHIEAGYYAVATSNFTAYAKPKKEKSAAHILSIKTGDMFLIIEKDPEKYSKWPVKILTEEHGALYVNNLDAHHFVYVKCGGNLIGKSFCITGELSHPRSVYQKIIEMNGGSFKTAISKSLSYLITNESMASTKMIKAQDLGINVISEYDFLAMVG
jgi:NAD-dependent DNA ligase